VFDDAESTIAPHNARTAPNRNTRSDVFIEPSSSN
jgi:hypothetical protein